MPDAKWSKEQTLAITLRNQNIVVSAGAGSGKTTVLVERVMTLLLGEPKADVHRLLIVTFTEAAAAEMRERIGRAISQRISEARQFGDSALVAHLSRQASLLEVAHISTLHSFCMMIVRRNFVRLGLDPQIRIMGDDEFTMLRHALLERLLEGFLRDTPESVDRMLEAFASSNPLSIVPLVLRLDEFSRSQPNPGQWLKGVLVEYQRAKEGESLQNLSFAPFLYQWILREVEEASQLFREGVALSRGIDGYEAYTDELAELGSLVQAVKFAVHEQSAISEIQSRIAPLLSRKSPRAPKDVEGEIVKNKRKVGLAQLKQVDAILIRGEENLVGDLNRLHKAVSQLVDFVLQFQDAFAEEKRARGVLDYSDLEHFALKSVTDASIGEADRMRRHFLEIFVDEYQDTSPIQDAIVEAIARPEGNVFVVGDVKQSIYRFRMAEPKIFLAKQAYASNAESASAIHLTDNYRSRHFVVDAVNDVFSKIFTPRFGGIVYDESARMNASAQYPEADDDTILKGGVEVHLLERQALTRASQCEAEDPASDDEELALIDSGFEPSAMEKEAMVIASCILDLMGMTGKSRRKVWDKSRKEYRPLMYRDIVVLLRSVRGRMNVILDALRSCGIPAYGATTSGFFDAMEVKWMQAALTVLDEPYRELSLAALLRSPLVGFSDEELATIRLQSSGNFYEALQACARRGRARKNHEESSTASPNTPQLEAGPLPQKLQARCRQFLATLQEWRTLARRSKAATVIRAIYQQTGILDYVLGMEDGEIRQANLQLLLDKASAYDKSSADGAFGYAQWMEATISKQIDAGEARTLGENEDVVRVMTIHQSKGLEFPVVFVADLGKQFYEDHGERIMPLHPALGFGPELLDARLQQRWPTVASIAISMANETDTLAEEARILYVAMTRARDYLVLVGSASQLQKALDKNRFVTVGAEDTLSLERLVGARTYLDWLLPIWLSHKDGAVLRELANLSGFHAIRLDDETRFSFYVWGLPNTPVIPTHSVPSRPDETDEENTPLYQSGLRDEELRQITVDAAAATHEPARRSEVDARSVGAHAMVPSKVSATDLRRLWVATHPSDRKSFKSKASAKRLLRVPSAVAQESTTGRERGSAFHAIMQRIDLELVRQGMDMSEIVSSLVASGIISRETTAAVDVTDLTSFFESEAGRRVLSARTVFREHPFLCQLPVEGDGAETDATRFVVVQGVIDVLAKEDDGWLIVDYKTDNIRSADVSRTAFEYAAQVEVYRRAVLTLTKNETVEALLYFVRPRVTVAQPPLNLEELWAKS